MRFQLFPAGIIVVLLLAACKKEKSLEEPLVQNTCDYAPYSTGSVFEYEQTYAATPDTDAFSLQVKGDSMVNNELYRLLEEDGGGATSLFRCGGGSYIQLADVSELTNTASEPVQTIYLKDNVPLGQGWEDQFIINLPIVGKVELTANYTVIQRGTSKTVLGKVYKDVIGVRMEVSVPPYLPPTEFNTGYYAKGVGLIEMNNDTDTIRLKSYTIR